LKVNELKPIKEGFIDNLVAKVKNMAGSDGVTGFVRALSGQSASLKKFADVINNAATPKITDRLGQQIGSIKDGTTPVPLAMIYKQVIAVAAQIAQKEQIDVSAIEIQSTIKSNKEAVLRMVLNGSEFDDKIVKDVFQAILNNSATITDTDLGQTISTVSLIVAGTIILVQTEKEDTDAETALDPTLKTKFEQESDQFNREVLDPTSGIVKTLNPNERLKDNLEALVIQMVKTVQDKYLVLPADKLTALETTPPALIAPIQLKSMLASHDNTLDAGAVDTAQNKINSLIQAQFGTWIKLAAKESATGRKAGHSFDSYREWAKEALSLIDNMNVDSQQQTQKPEANKEESPEVKQTFDDAREAMGKAYKTALAQGNTEQQAIQKAQQAADNLLRQIK
jgi:hypothetical protein